MPRSNNTGKNRASKDNSPLIFLCASFILIAIIFIAGASKLYAQKASGNVVLHFKAIANNKTIVLNDSSYSNAFGEIYNISRLKFHISNVRFSKPAKYSNADDVYLIDMATSDSIILNVATGSYNNLHFLLGVDSSLNCSGAQAGSLDPLNGMFWTWNTGYIFFKMEGYSPSSTADLHRIEQHIGGYRSPYNAARFIDLVLPGKLDIAAGETKHININLAMDKFFYGPHQIKLSEKPMLMSPGAEAIKAADNIAQSFSIESMK